MKEVQEGMARFVRNCFDCYVVYSVQHPGYIERMRHLYYLLDTNMNRATTELYQSIDIFSIQICGVIAQTCECKVLESQKTDAIR